MRTGIFTALLAAVLPISASAALSSRDVDFISNDVVVYGVETLDDLDDLLPSDIEVEALDSAADDGSAIEVRLISGDEIVEGVINPLEATLTLYSGPDTQGCYLQGTGLYMCINHVLYEWRCWTGSWYCFFYEPSCVLIKIPASCQ